VSEQIADFQVQVVAENLRHCVPRGDFWSSRCALQHRQKQQGPTTKATCYVVSLSQAREVEAVFRFLFQFLLFSVFFLTFFKCRNIFFILVCSSLSIVLSLKFGEFFFIVLRVFLLLCLVCGSVLLLILKVFLLFVFKFGGCLVLNALRLIIISKGLYFLKWKFLKYF